MILCPNGGANVSSGDSAQKSASERALFLSGRFPPRFLPVSPCCVLLSRRCRDFLEPSFKLKRAQLGLVFFQSRDLLRIAVDACFEPLEWCGWLVVYPLLPTPAHLGSDVLHRRAKEITKQFIL